jgi:guanylate kinase
MLFLIKHNRNSINLFIKMEKKMGKIFCVMGKSGCGKDTIFKEFINDNNLNLKPIILYTTRPKRQGEENGVEYFFINEKRLEELRSLGKIIELRKYNTVHGIWYYCTIDDGQFNLSNDYLLICTLEAYNNIKMYFGEEFVVPIYIYVDDGKRLGRALSREMLQKTPQYEELCRRFLADCIDFSEQKLNEANIIEYYDNENLSDCVAEARKLFTNQINKDV